MRINLEIIKGITKQQKKQVIMLFLQKRKNLSFFLSKQNNFSFFFLTWTCFVRFTIDRLHKKKQKRPESESLYTN